jgi:hypothetical protein
MSSARQADVLQQAQAQMSEILSRLQEMQHATNALRVPQAHLSICAHLSRQIQSRKEQTLRVRTAAAELRSVLRSCVNADSGNDMGVSNDVAPRANTGERSSIEEVCARLQEAVSSMQNSSALGASAQAALAHDMQSSRSQQHVSNMPADGLDCAPSSSEVPLTLHGQIEALLHLPHSVLDKLPS